MRSSPLGQARQEEFDVLHEMTDWGAGNATELVAERERAQQTIGARAALNALAQLARQSARVLPEKIADAGLLCSASLRQGGKILACGNGGSAADASHFVAELIGRMRLERAPLPAMSLAVDPSVLTCIANDYGYEQLFARQVQGVGRPGDVLLAISTSGKSANVLRALEAAREREMKTIMLAGEGGDAALELADVLIRVPSRDTARVQEIHTVSLHAICEVVEQSTFR